MTHIQVHPKICIFKTVSTKYTYLMIFSKVEILRDYCQIILVYSTLLADYVGFITAKPKVLHVAG